MANFGEKVLRGERLGNGFRWLPEPGGGERTVEKKIDESTDTR